MRKDTRNARAFLESAARRAKYEFFLGKVISKNHVGWLPKDVVYEGRSIGWDTPYRVAEAKSVYRHCH